MKQASSINKNVIIFIHTAIYLSKSPWQKYVNELHQEFYSPGFPPNYPNGKTARTFFIPLVIIIERSCSGGICSSHLHSFIACEKSQVEEV